MRPIILYVFALVMSALLPGAAATAACQGGKAKPETPRFRRCDKAEAKAARTAGRPGIAAMPIPARNIPALVDQSSLVLLGTVVAVSDSGAGVLRWADSEEPVELWQAQVEVEAVFKGQLPRPGAVAEIMFFTSESIAWPQVHARDHGVFLVASDGGVLEPFFPFLPTRPGAPLPPPDRPALDGVRQQLVASLLPDTLEPTLTSCVEGVLGLGAREAADRLVALAASDDPQVAGDGLWGLLGFQDARAFPAAADFLLQDPPGTVRQWIGLLVAVGGLTDPALAGDVLPLLAGSNVQVRQAALSALRTMHLPEMAPVLATALSTDPELANRYIAMMGVHEITAKSGPDWAPSWPIFLESPSIYLDRWMNWWETEGKARYGAGQAPSG